MGSTASNDDGAGAANFRLGTATDDRAESAVQRIGRLATKLMSARVAAVTILAAGEAKIEAAVGIAPVALGRDLPLHDDTLAHERVLCVLDARRDPRLADHPLVVGPPHMRFYAGAPLRAADGRVLGALIVMDPSPRDSFSDDDGDTLRDLAAMVAAHVDARQAIGHTAPVTGLANRIRLLQDVNAFIAHHDKQGGGELSIAIMETLTPHEYSELIRVFGAGCADDAFEQRLAVIPPAHAARGIDMAKRAGVDEMASPERRQIARMLERDPGIVAARHHDRRERQNGFWRWPEFAQLLSNLDPIDIRWRNQQRSGHGPAIRLPGKLRPPCDRKTAEAVRGEDDRRTCRPDRLIQFGDPGVAARA